MPQIGTRADSMQSALLAISVANIMITMTTAIVIIILLSLVVQVTQQSAVTYLHKFAGQPVPQLPAAHSIQQQSCAPSTALGSKPGSNSPPRNQNGQKGSVEAQAGAGGQTALKLPLLRPAPPLLKPCTGQPRMQCSLESAKSHPDYIEHRVTYVVFGFAKDITEVGSLNPCHGAVYRQNPNFR